MTKPRLRGECIVLIQKRHIFLYLIVDVPTLRGVLERCHICLPPLCAPLVLLDEYATLCDGPTVEDVQFDY